MPRQRAHGLHQSTWETQDIESHMELIRRMVERSLHDGETRQLAVRLVSQRYDAVTDPRTGEPIAVVEAWGRHFTAPDLALCEQGDDECELAVLWAFLVHNVRYTYDPDGTDTFATLKQSLLAGGGDCDDQTIAMCALARAIGFSECYARVVSLDGEQWSHVYPVVGLNKDGKGDLVAFDMTVPGKLPGWEVNGGPRKRGKNNVLVGRGAVYRDFPMF
jgi:hypothetical protein